MTNLSPEQLDAIASDFESGWSEQRLDAAGASWRPGMSRLLPDNVQQALHARAVDEGVTDAELIERAVRAYLAV